MSQDLVVCLSDFSTEQQFPFDGVVAERFGGVKYPHKTSSILALSTQNTKFRIKHSILYFGKICLRKENSSIILENLNVLSSFLCTSSLASSFKQGNYFAMKNGNKNAHINRKSDGLILKEQTSSLQHLKKIHHKLNQN